MSRIIKDSEWVTEVRRTHFFEFVNEKGAGYDFDVDLDGCLLNEKNREKYLACKSGEVNGFKVRDCGISESSHEYRNPSVLECNCGNHIELDGDVSCETCGQWYNASGQKLVDPCYWGEETGEQFDSSGRYIGGGDY